MTKPVRLQLSRRKGFDLQALSLATNGLPAVKIDRTTKFGNPFRVGEPVDMNLVRRWGWRFKWPDHVCGDAEEAVRRFRACLFLDEAIHDYVRQELRGKNLACWCEHAPCHADVLLELANAEAA
jgi:hypothetical protein